MAAFLVILSLVIAFFGLVFSSRATIGMCVIGLACLVAILARIAQAAAQHDAMKATAKPQAP